MQRAREVAEEFDDVVVREVDTGDPATMREWGLADGLFLDSREIGFGPPLTREKLRKKFRKRVRKLMRLSTNPDGVPTQFLWVRLSSRGSGALR